MEKKNLEVKQISVFENLPIYILTFLKILLHLNLLLLFLNLRHGWLF